MDFFEHQDVARKKTGRLVGLMVLAVVVLIALVYAVVIGVFVAIQQQGGLDQSDGVYAGGLPDIPYWRLLGVTSVGVLLVVAGGSLYKTSQLSGGGKTVALSLGGRPVDHDTTDPDERRLLNIVQEMAIASGSPVPGVYMLDHEEAINAFAAGWTLDDAVIGVTRGCVEQLSRDELQGVIAHEFSHILHGDMRLNLRLVGLIFGILVISVIGATIMRSIMYTGHRHRSRSSGDGKGQGGVIAIFFLGLALYIVGYVGVLLGRVIQAAISRQREFLADASAVQYTRNPDGIANALRRIGGLSTGSKIQSAHAVEHSHLFFGSAVSSFLGGVFATHPPLPQRIARIQPDWAGSYLEPQAGKAGGNEPADAGSASMGLAQASGPVHPAASGFSASMPNAKTSPSPSPTSTADIAPTAIEQIGQPTPNHLLHAQKLIDSLPAVLRSAAQTSTGAQAIVFALLLDRSNAKTRTEQLEYLEQQTLGPVAVLAQRLAKPTVTLPVHLRLPLLDLALPALIRLHPQVVDQVHAHVDALIAADDRLDIFEWALRQVLWRHLRPVDFTGSASNRRLRRCVGSLELLLSVLAHVSGRDDAAADLAFAAAAKRVPRLQLARRSPDKISMSGLTDAVDELAVLVPADQKVVISACAAAIAADGLVTAREAELMRAVAETLGVPVPPLLPNQRLI